MGVVAGRREQDATEGRRAEKRPSFWTVMKRCIQIAGSVNAIFLAIFLAIGSPLLAWISVASMAMYAAAYVLVVRRKNTTALVLIWAEVLGHAALGTLMVGWESGFHYYLLMFIPAIFVSTRTRNATVAVFVLWCFYVVLDYAMLAVQPLEPINSQALAGLRYFNISVVFAMFAYLSSYYYRNIVETQGRLKKLAMTDPLTGLYNRRHALQVADAESLHRPQATRLSFIIADIDHFKEINDTYGHDAGDSVLVAVSNAIRESIREEDSASRWGGEEFLVVLPNTDPESAALAAERIRARVAALRIAVGDGTVAVSVTLGVSCHSADEQIDSTIARADASLYCGKKAGRNRVVISPFAPAQPHSV